MAATRIMPIHVDSNRSIKTILKESVDYSMNIEKTQGGLLIQTHMCSAQSADYDFEKTIQLYYERKGTEPLNTKRKKDILAYHFRQAFAHGEITPDKANEVGVETALAVTDGKHAFIVCTHDDKEHYHNHIIFCSVDIDSERKFVDPFRSHKRLFAPESDRLCKKHGLSVIDDPDFGSGAYKPEKQKANKP